MKISNRLKSLSKYVERTDSLIDIGCDHALLDVYLIKENILNKIIISDINSSALNQGLENIEKYKISNNIEARLGNGLEVLTNKDNINTILISGMGTNTILKILNTSYLKNINKLIIESNNDYELLRREVIKLGFYIMTEEAIEDNNKVYLNIIFKRGQKNITKEELKYGITSMINKNIYYENLIKKYKKILLNVDDEKIRKEIDYLKQNK